MKNPPKTLELKFERTIMAGPAEVYAAWLNPKIPGNPWHEADKLIFNPKVDGFFYWLINKVPHYGRFTEIKRAARIQHTWVSPYTSGEESMVTLTFRKSGKNTLMTLVHSDLPNNEKAKAHEQGWVQFLDEFAERYSSAARKKK